MVNNCECRHWASDCLFLNTAEHLPSCPKYSYKKEMAEITTLLREIKKGIDFWASEEDGIPEELWGTYRKLCHMLFLPVPGEP